MSATSITSNSLKVHGLNIHYIEKKGDQRTTIVFVHGRAMSCACWERQFSDEKLSGLRLIALDLPGHGLSDRSEDLKGIYSLAGFKELLAGFIDQLQLTSYVLAGLSIGGHVVLQTLPGLTNCIGAFVMTMPFTKPIQFDLMFLNAGTIARAYNNEPTDEDLKNYMSLLFRPEANEIPRFILEAFKQTDPKIHEGILKGVIDGEYLDETEILRNAKIPVAVLAGLNEQAHNLGYLKGLAVPVWRNSVHLVPNAGHLLNWENSGLVNTLLVEFISELQSS